MTKRKFAAAVAAFRKPEEAPKPVGESLGYPDVAILSTAKLEANDRTLALTPTKNPRRFRLAIQDAGGWEEPVGHIEFNPEVTTLALLTGAVDLTDRERMIIELRYAHFTQKAIAAAFGVSPARISQIEMRAWRKARKVIVK